MTRRESLSFGFQQQSGLMQGVVLLGIWTLVGTLGFSLWWRDGRPST